jgi:hypothetical protein
MKKTRLAIIGLGNLGRKCAETMFSDQSTVLAGVVRRPGSTPASWLKAPAVAHISELNEVDAALICVPVDAVMGIAKGLLQSRIPIVECARLHDDAFLGHKSEIHRAALHHKVPAVVGAGCDPGALSLFRSHFALMAPRGHTETSLHTGTSLPIPWLRQASRASGKRWRQNASPWEESSSVMSMLNLNPRRTRPKWRAPSSMIPSSSMNRPWYFRYRVLPRWKQQTVV